jgi:hypothetical protein
VYVLPYRCKRALLAYSKIHGQNFPKPRELAEAVQAMVEANRPSASQAGDSVSTAGGSGSSGNGSNARGGSQNVLKLVVECFDGYHGEHVKDASICLYRLTTQPTTDIAETSKLPELPNEQPLQQQQQQQVVESSNSSGNGDDGQPRAQTRSPRSLALVRPPPARRPQSAGLLGGGRNKPPANPYELVLLTDGLPIPISVWSRQDMHRALQELGCSPDVTQDLERRGVLNAASLLELDDTTLQKAGARLLTTRKAILRLIQRIKPLARITQVRASQIVTGSLPSQHSSHFRAILYPQTQVRQQSTAKSEEGDVLEQQLFQQAITDSAGGEPADGVYARSAA